jgi:hypothetical protein
MDYRILGRIERRPEGDFRAVASAVPDRNGAGPNAADVCVGREQSLDDCRIVLGRLVHQLASNVMRRGDQVVWLDVR